MLDLHCNAVDNTFRKERKQTIRYTLNFEVWVSLSDKAYYVLVFPH